MNNDFFLPSELSGLLSRVAGPTSLPSTLPQREATKSRHWINKNRVNPYCIRCERWYAMLSSFLQPVSTLSVNHFECG